MLDYLGGCNLITQALKSRDISFPGVRDAAEEKAEERLRKVWG